MMVYGHDMLELLYFIFILFLFYFIFPLFLGQ